MSEATKLGIEMISIQQNEILDFECWRIQKLHKNNTVFCKHKKKEKIIDFKHNVLSEYGGLNLTADIHGIAITRRTGICFCEKCGKIFNLNEYKN